jgi:hypothetical protein
MYSASRSARAVALVVLSGFSGATTYSQTVQFLSREAASFRFASLSPSPSPMPCGRGLDATSTVLRGDIPTTTEIHAPCDPSMENALPVLPCNLADRTAAGCPAPADPVHEQLNIIGRPGQAILQARERVLEILQADNSCSQWYRSKGAYPAAIFRTLTFELDAKGTGYILETLAQGGLSVFHNPYVASVTQGGGSYSMVTVNRNGAFFVALAKVEDQPREGGPLSFRGVRYLKVGPYSGNTLQAQVVTLLHEFGHLLDLLPPDRGDYGGKSLQNTMEVLRFCRAQVESKDRHSLFSASR